MKVAFLEGPPREDLELLRQHAAALRRSGTAFLIIGCVMATSAAEARLEGRMRVSFVKDNFAKCVMSSKRNATGRDILPSIVTRVCTCSADYVADRLVPGDIASVRLGNRAERRQIFDKMGSLSDRGLQTCLAAARSANENLGPDGKLRKNADSGI